MKYSILHFIQKKEEAYIVLSALEEITNDLDLATENKEFENLRDNGTKHEIWEKELKSIIENKKQENLEREIMESLNKEMREMDEKDMEKKKESRENENR